MCFSFLPGFVFCRFFFPALSLFLPFRFHLFPVTALWFSFLSSHDRGSVKGARRGAVVQCEHPDFLSTSSSALTSHSPTAGGAGELPVSCARDQPRKDKIKGKKSCRITLTLTFSTVSVQEHTTHSSGLSRI